MTTRCLVLGSSGQIGHPLSLYLEQCGLDVERFDVVLGRDFDLRIAHSPTLRRSLSAADYVFFLAFDVGGSRYLAKMDRSFEFIRNNSVLMSNTFEALKQWGGPFIFASTQMSALPQTSYGALKATGEHFTRSLGGLVVRLWNVYGQEEQLDRAHVITDFIRMALEQGTIRMRTDGSEVRDFMHVDDCARGLETVMRNHERLTNQSSICLATGRWTSVAEVAELVALDLKVPVISGTRADHFETSSHEAPTMGQVPGWRPGISIQDGVQMMIESALSRRSPARTVR